MKELLVRKGERPPEETLKVLNLFLTEVDGDFYEEGLREFKGIFGPFALRSLGFDEEEFAYPLGAVYRYAKLTQKGFTPFIRKLRPFQDEGFVRIDLKARRGLELLESTEGRRDHSLMGVIDRTLTGMGRKIVKELERIGRNAQLVGEVDYVQSLAEVASQKGWTKPEVYEIEEGRHPVIEEFIHVITGPNMAGKSSYIRQTALIVILSHMGSFVPAKRVKVGSVDAVFTRIGSGDVLAMGVSTFMNEMLDVANMLSNATRKSLIILDEIGRGTSTYDGIAITKALVEFISSKLGARTLLATHFLEITELEGRVRGVKNYHMSVSEEEGGIVFLYTLSPGRAEGSFGVEVARMAELPQELVERAKEILTSLEDRTLPVPGSELKEKALKIVRSRG